MKILPLHHRALELEFAGRSAEEIARELRKAKGTIQNWQADADYKKLREKLVGELRKNATQKLDTLLDRALDRLGKLIDAKRQTKLGAIDDGTTQLGAVKEILHQTLGKPVEKVEHSNKSGEPFLFALAPSQFVKNPKSQAE